MPIMKRMGGPMAFGGGTSYADIYQQDPDQAAALKQRGNEFDQSLDFQKQQFGAKQQRFDQLFPYAQSLIGQYGQVGGGNKPQPSITRGPIYTPDQIQQQTNAGVAGNDARYQTLMRQLATSNAGRGFGASSPAMQSQMTQLGIANIGENARTIREMPMQYAQANADSTYRTDALAQQQYAQGEDEDIRRRQTQLQGVQGLLAQLAGLV